MRKAANWRIKQRAYDIVNDGDFYDIVFSSFADFIPIFSW